MEIQLLVEPRALCMRSWGLLLSDDNPGDLEFVVS